mgnify:CR=1 FL=1
MSEEKDKREMNIPLFQIVDTSDKLVKPKTKIFDMPFRIAVVGKSGSGKTSVLVQLLASPFFYGNDFQGENIYIVSGSLTNDEKLQRLIKYKNIPEENLFPAYNDGEINVLYEFLENEFKTLRKEGKKPPHNVILFDDVSYAGNLAKKFGAMSRLVCNCRKISVSLVILSQYFKHLSPVVRQNVNGAIIFHQSNSQVDAISEDFNYADSKKIFRKTFHDVTAKPHGFFVINETNPRNEWYSDSFQRYLDI